MLTMSYSAYNAWHACPRKYYLSYVLRWEPLATPSYFADGRLFHMGVEMWATGVPLLDVIRAVRKEGEKARVSVLSIAEHADLTIREGKIAGMVSAFATVRGRAPYGASADIVLEEWLRDKHNPSVHIAGKIDLANWKLGLIVDFKTVGGGIDAAELAAERASMQYYIYGFLAGQQGHKIKKILVELAAKPDLRLKANETLPEFTARIAAVCRERAQTMIARVEIPWDKKAKELGAYYVEQLYVLANRIADSYAVMRPQGEFSPAVDFPPVTNSCNLFSPCEFFPICSKDMLRIPAKPPTGFRLRQKSE